MISCCTRTLQRALHATLLFSVLLPCQSIAQHKEDSVKRTSATKKALSKGIQLISTSNSDTVLNERSIDSFSEYSGRIIRKIETQQIGFEVSIYDSTKKIKNSVSKIANALHVDTRNKIIKSHLFIRPGEILNPHKLADNERFLRDKDFILDSRIVISPVEGTDSVDLLVVTRDVFSIGGYLGGSIPSAPRIGVYDANVDGRAQRIQFTALIDADRTPNFGYLAEYSKSSAFGSLANFRVGYTQLNTGPSIGDEIEYSFYASIDRPLVSPYSRIAGGMGFNYNWSKNVYNDPDSTFLDYSYTLTDIWLGYNLGINRIMTNRAREFFAIRYYEGNFIDKVDQEGFEENLKYNNNFGYLAEFTLYRKNFFRTRYVLGFGRTEDIPSGFSLGFTAGYVKQLYAERPYGALKFDYKMANKKGNFYQLAFETGGFYANGRLEDIVVIPSASFFTRAINIGNYKSRNLARFTYTEMFRRVTNDWLQISRSMIPGIRTDSLKADRRLSFHIESELFTPWQLLGFRFAPFTAVDWVGIRCYTCETEPDQYWGFSLGVRTRNENLIFGTMEVKVTYIPEDEFGDRQIVFGFRQNLRVKNSGSFVQAPSPVRYNF